MNTNRYGCVYVESGGLSTLATIYWSCFITQIPLNYTTTPKPPTQAKYEETKMKTLLGFVYYLRGRKGWNKNWSSSPMTFLLLILWLSAVHP